MKSNSTPKKSPAKKEVMGVLAEEKKHLSSFQNLLFQTPVAIAIFRGSNYIVELANNKALGIMVKDQGIIGKPFFEAMPELEHPIKEIFDNIVRSGVPFQVNEMELSLFRNGKKETGWFNLNYQPIRDDDNTISGILASANDVTNQVIARRKIEDSDKRYNMMLMNSPFGFAVLKGKNMVITLANDSIKTFWGKGKEVEGKSLFDVIPELKNSDFPDLIGKVYTTGIPFYGNELLAPILRNGKLEDLYFNFVYQPYLEADETISGVSIIAYEVTDSVILKKALEAQRAAEQKASKLVEDINKRYYTMLMESPFAFCVLKGKDMTVSLANDLIKEFWGKGNMVEGKPILQVLPELKDQPFPAMLDKVYTTGIPVYANQILTRLQHKDKMEERYFNIVYQPDHDAEGTISGVITIAYDVTEMVLARKKIEDSDKRYNMMLMNSPFTFAVLKGKDLIIDLANDRIKEVWGRGNDIEGKSLLEIMPELKNTTFLDMLDEVRATGIPFHGVEVQSPKNMHGHIKEEYFFNFVFQPYLEADETISGITIIGNDVTEQVIAKRKIEESEHRFHEMVNSSLSLISICKGENMIIEIANDAMLASWGKGNIIGKSVFDVVPETKEQGFDKLLLGVYKTGVPVMANEVPVTMARNGTKEIVYYSFIYQPQRNVRGEIEGVATIAYEVTDQVLIKNKLIESEKKFKQLAELMPQKVWTADTEGNKNYFNQTLLDYVGMSSEELKGDKWKQMIHPDDWEQDEMKWKKSIKTGKIYQSESRLLRKDGEYLWHLTIAVPLKDEKGKIVLWIGSKTEIEKQRKQKEILEEAVDSRTAELKQANEELIKMNKELEAFTYVSSHDLQEPLRKIRTMAGRILEKEEQNLSDSGKNYFRLMQNAAERMQTLIQDLLAFSLLSMADRKFENTDLNIIIEEVKKEFKESIEEKHATIEVKEICEVKLIPFQFRQLMHNLIGNALKFSKPNIPPHIIIESHNITYSNVNIENLIPHQEYCHISVSDNGIGFEKEFAEKIFEVFQKLHGKDEYAGTGIGLAIVKKIVENHNGIITATSELKKGTTFNIYIPV